MKLKYKMLEKLLIVNFRQNHKIISKFQNLDEKTKVEDKRNKPLK